MSNEHLFGWSVPLEDGWLNVWFHDNDIIKRWTWVSKDRKVLRAQGIFSVMPTELMNAFELADSRTLVGSNENQWDENRMNIERLWLGANE